jgi:hypothetical protein
MSQLLRDANVIVESHASELFKEELPVNDQHCRVYFQGDVVNVWMSSKKKAVVLRSFYKYLACLLKRWNYKEIKIFWDNSGCQHFSIPCVFAKPHLIPIPKEVTKPKNMTKPLIATSSIWTGTCQLSRPLVDVISWFIETPNIRGGLVRLSDERQLLVTPAMAATVWDATAEEIVQRKMTDFWHPEDLHNLHQKIKQQGSTGFEHTWRGVNKSKTHWSRFTHHFRVIVDDFGTAYRVFTNLDLEAIDLPELVTR